MQNSVQLTLEKCGFELSVATYSWIFFFFSFSINTCTGFDLQFGIHGWRGPTALLCAVLYKVL